MFLFYRCLRKGFERHFVVGFIPLNVNYVDLFKFFHLSFKVIPKIFSRWKISFKFFIFTLRFLLQAFHKFIK